MKNNFQGLAQLKVNISNWHMQVRDIVTPIVNLEFRSGPDLM